VGYIPWQHTSLPKFDHWMFTFPNWSQRLWRRSIVNVHIKSGPVTDVLVMRQESVKDQIVLTRLVHVYGVKLAARSEKGSVTECHIDLGAKDGRER
jgi:hypothetical protein